MELLTYLIRKVGGQITVDYHYVKHEMKKVEYRNIEHEIVWICWLPRDHVFLLIRILFF